MKLAVARWNWVIHSLVFGAAAVLWSLAVARGRGESPIGALPFGFAQMTVAGVMAVGVWRMTAVVPWRSNPWKFYGANAAAMMALAFGYTSAQMLPYINDLTFVDCFHRVFGSAVVGWNLLMGGWLYLAIAGVCYSRRADESLRASERDRAGARIALREAQLAALSTQLQPHFLFNALHTVGALVHVDPDRADRALDELGKLLRYALRGHTDVVTFGQEWAFTRDYLAFEALRLGERLRLDVDIDDRALDVQVPPFTLQPLVENAVRHGVSNSPDGGSVQVRVARQGSVLTVTVRNTIAGAADCSGMAGSGLTGLRDRLSLKYGAGRATVSTEAGDHFQVTVTLPCDFDEVAQ